MMGGIIVKYFPDCYQYEEGELNEILSAVLSSEECRAAVRRVQAAADSMEGNEKTKNAQLAKTMKASLPNDWSYELAEEVVRDYVQRNFVSKGMCVDWAINDSVNPQGIHNLHFHLMLTLRPVGETANGERSSGKNTSLIKTAIKSAVNPGKASKAVRKLAQANPAEIMAAAKMRSWNCLTASWRRKEGFTCLWSALPTSIKRPTGSF